MELLKLLSPPLPNTNSAYQRRELPVVRQAHHEREKLVALTVRPELVEGPDVTFSNRIGIRIIFSPGDKPFAKPSSLDYHPSRMTSDSVPGQIG